MIDRENVRQAILNASKGKRNRQNVKRYLDDIDKTINDILEILPNWLPSDPRTFPIFDTHRKKVRIISQPKFFPDQIIHHMYVQVMEPIYMKGMYDHSYGSIPGRGTHAAVKRVKKWLEKDPKNTKYCAEFDIRRFYVYMLHHVVRQKTWNKIKDVDMMTLTVKILLTYHTGDYDEGVPIGFYSSQWFANFYLEELDHYIKELLHVPYYVRYMDNLWIFGPNKKKLHRAKRMIERKLKSEGLEFNNHWQVYPVDSRPINMLGYKVYRDKILIGDGTYRRLRRAMDRISRKPTPTEHDLATLWSYNGVVKITSCNKMRRELRGMLGKLGRRLGCPYVSRRTRSRRSSMSSIPTAPQS